DLFLPTAEMPLPVPVTDTDGELVGVVPRATLLAALGNQNGGDEQPTDASFEGWPEPVDTGVIDRVLAEADDAVSPQAAGERSDRCWSASEFRSEPGSTQPPTGSK